MAKELSTSGFRTVVLEQGPWLGVSDFRHDELSVGFRSGLTNNHSLQTNTIRASPEQKAELRPVVEYGRLVGGGSVHFTANYWRFHPNDFRESSQFGPVAGADLRDWPITYKDLEPNYANDDQKLGISRL